MITLYGLKNCDSCRAARRAFAAAGVEVRFHDLRADGLDEDRLRSWMDALGWEVLINRRSTTWRKLAESERTGIDATSALQLALAQPSLLKRPIIEKPDGVSLGFDPRSL